jgi:hypothetical protein
MSRDEVGRSTLFLGGPPCQDFRAMVGAVGVVV